MSERIPKSERNTFGEEKRALRAAVDALEALRKSGGIDGNPDAILHVSNNQ